VKNTSLYPFFLGGKKLFPLYKEGIKGCVGLHLTINRIIRKKKEDNLIDVLTTKKVYVTNPNLLGY
tara:strand:- start:381 stop:578 length:198 start_codon:yes stop_codon:yes gene_type:complete